MLASCLRIDPTRGVCVIDEPRLLEVPLPLLLKFGREEILNMGKNSARSAETPGEKCESTSEQKKQKSKFLPRARSSASKAAATKRRAWCSSNAFNCLPDITESTKMARAVDQEWTAMVGNCESCVLWRVDRRRNDVLSGDGSGCCNTGAISMARLCRVCVFVA